MTLTLPEVNSDRSPVPFELPKTKRPAFDFSGRASVVDNCERRLFFSDFDKLDGVFCDRIRKCAHRF